MAERVWTLSNLLSASRIVLVVPIAILLLSDEPGDRLWAAAIVLVAVATDFIDGYLARRLHEVSDLGKVLDPLADKIAVATVAIVLWSAGDIELWYLGLVLFRDVIILAGGFYIRSRKNIIPQSNWPGKIAVSAIALYLLLALLRLEGAEGVVSFVMWSSIVLMVISVAAYAQRIFVGRKAF